MPAHRRTATHAFVHCPHCGAVASTEWTATLGRVQHVKVRCVHRHWFLLPADLLTEYPMCRPAASYG
jgi:hypothetical protein